jgi:hypothetical protein
MAIKHPDEARRALKNAYTGVTNAHNALKGAIELNCGKLPLLAHRRLVTLRRQIESELKQLAEDARNVG